MSSLRTNTFAIAFVGRRCTANRAAIAVLLAARSDKIGGMDRIGAVLCTGNGRYGLGDGDDDDDDNDDDDDHGDDKEGQEEEEEEEARPPLPRGLPPPAACWRAYR